MLIFAHKLEMIMKRNLLIELLEDGEMVSPGKNTDFRQWRVEEDCQV